MSDLVKAVEEEQMKVLPPLNVGDTVKIHYRIIEGKSERVQIYEGLLIAINNSGPRKSGTVRKISHGVGVERIFPLHSPKINKIEVTRRGKVRRAKLYYMRDRVGKAAMKVKELLTKKASSSRRSGE